MQGLASVRLMFSLNFSPKVLILLDVTPDQSLLSEGVAREVVNRIQKLRKKVTAQH